MRASSLQLCRQTAPLRLTARTWLPARFSKAARRLPRALVGEDTAIIREAQLADLDGLLVVENRSRPGGNWSRKNLEAEILRDRATVLVAERQQQAVGVLVAWAVSPDELHVMELAVLPEHRRQGLARRLMQLAIDKHRGWVQTVLLEVRASNQGAQQLYEQLGFVEVGIRRKYYDNGEDALLMNLELGGNV